jgi:hypothetical protein
LCGFDSSGMVWQVRVKILSVTGMAYVSLISTHLLCWASLVGRSECLVNRHRFDGAGLTFSFISFVGVGWSIGKA